MNNVIKTASLSIIVGVVAAFLNYFFKFATFAHDEVVGILSISVTFASILAGFSITGIAILFALDTEFMKGFRKTDFWSELIGYFKFTIYSLFAFCIYSIFIIIVKTILLSPPFCIYVCSVWIGLFVISVLASFRSTKLMLLIFQRPTDK